MPLRRRSLSLFLIAAVGLAVVDQYQDGFGVSIAEPFASKDGVGSQPWEPFDLSRGLF